MVCVRVMLADDHREFLACTTKLLERDFEVVGAVGDGQALVDDAVRLAPDIVVLDISMPGLNGFEAAQRLQAAGSTAKLIFLTIHQDEEFVSAARAVGARGYVVKRRLATDLLAALREVHSGRSFFSQLE